MSDTGAVGRRPVSLRSRFVRRPDRPYTEVAGRSLVVVPSGHAAYELAPAAVALWAALDDRPLGELVASRPPDQPPVAYLELVRRWRALGLVEERTALAGLDTDPGVEATGPPATVRLHGRAEAAGVVLVVGPGLGGVTVTVAPPVVDGSAGPLLGLVELADGAVGPGPDDASDRRDPTGSTGTVEHLDAIGVFGALVGAADEEDLRSEGFVDALADLAERLVGRRVASGHPTRLAEAVSDLAATHRP